MTSSSTANSSKIQPLLQRADNSVDICVTFVLLWIAAASDTHNTASRTQYLDNFFSNMEGTRDYEESILAIINSNDIGSYVAVCNIQKRELSREECWYLLELAIGLAMVDGKITIAVNHIFRCLVDLFGVPIEEFKKLFLRTSNTIFPEAGDPSSMLWWEFGQDKSETRDNTYSVYSRYDDIGEAEARKILGVDQKADAAEIKKAYRRLAQHYHPDRYGSLDSSAAEKAEHTFRLVRRAYEVLKK